MAGWRTDTWTDDREMYGRTGGENTSLLGGGLGFCFCFSAGSSRNPRVEIEPGPSCQSHPQPGLCSRPLELTSPSLTPQGSQAPPCRALLPTARPPDPTLHTVKPSFFPPRLSPQMPRPVPPHHSRTGAQPFLPETFREEAPKSPSLAGEDFWTFWGEGNSHIHAVECSRHKTSCVRHLKSH